MDEDCRRHLMDEVMRAVDDAVRKGLWFAQGDIEVDGQPLHWQLEVHGG